MRSEIHPVVGVFPSRTTADVALEALHDEGVPPDRIVRLAPGDAPTAASVVPTTDAEQPEMGAAIGGVVGLSGGLFAASLLVPGVGPVSAVGAAATALLGLGGAVAGATVGNEIEAALEGGIPRDEVIVYEDALRQGRSVVVALAETAENAATVRQILAASGAESIDAAREDWWLGLRPQEIEHYAPDDADRLAMESAYRSGFEAALRSATSGRAVDELAAELRPADASPDAPREAAFRRGFERGTLYLQSWDRRRHG